MMPWTSTIKAAFNQTSRTPIEGKAIVVITYYFPTRQATDVDNRPNKYIIDGIKYNRIIADDTWEKMSYMVNGAHDAASPRTEIIVQNMEKWFASLRAQPK